MVKGMIKSSKHKLVARKGTISVVDPLEEERMRLLASILRIEPTPDPLDYYSKWERQLQKTFDTKADYKAWRAERTEKLEDDRKYMMSIAYTAIINGENIRSLILPPYEGL